MNECWLISGFIVLSSLAFLLAIYPVRAGLSKGWGLTLALAFGLVMLLAYCQWGAWPALQAYQQERQAAAKAQALLASIKSPQQLVDKLKAQLDNTPASARGWYLLGRIYASQNQWTLARDAFATSNRLNPDDELTAANYAVSLWQANGQEFTLEIRSKFQALLAKNPQQADALAMLAMDAWQRHDAHQAIVYWQQLLQLMPEHSKEARAIRKAIIKAQQQP